MRSEVARNAEEISDHADCQWRGIRLDQIDSAAILEAIDEPLGKPLNPGSEVLNLAGQEGRVDESAELGVAGWFQFQQGVAFEVVEWPKVLRRFVPAELFAGGDVENLPAKTPISEQCPDILVSTVTAMAQLLPLETSATLPHRGVEGIGIADKVGLARVKVDHAVPHVHPCRQWHCLTPLGLEPAS